MDCQTIKSCDLDGYVAARLLELLNPGKVAVTRDPYNDFRVIANCAPEDPGGPDLPRGVVLQRQERLHQQAQL